MEFLWLIGIGIALLVSAVKNYREQTKTVFLILLPMIIGIIVGSLTLQASEMIGGIIIWLGFLSVPLWVYIVSKIQEKEQRDLAALNDDSAEAAKVNGSPEGHQADELRKKSKVRKVVAGVLVSALAICLLTGLIVYDISYNTTKDYEDQFQKAVAAVKENDFEKARQLFSSLPSDYQGVWKNQGETSKYVPVENWIDKIDSYGTSDFIGEWQKGDWKLHIWIDVSFYMSCCYRLNTPSGDYDTGNLAISPDGGYAILNYRSKESQMGYMLVLKNSASIDVYDDDTYVVTLTKVSN